MTFTRTRLALLALVILGGALLSGAWAYFRILQQTSPEKAANHSTSSRPSEADSIQIDFPPQAESAGIAIGDHETVAANGAVKAPHPLHQIWEFNAQQPLVLLPQPLTAPSWYITGVVQQGKNTRVMVQFQGESQVRFYKVGEMLPGGSKLVWVKPGAIGVITPKRKNLQVPILGDSHPSASSSTEGKSEPKAR